MQDWASRQTRSGLCPEYNPPIFYAERQTADVIACDVVVSSPGWVLTPLVQKQIEARAAASGKSYEEEKLALCSEKHPSQGYVEPSDIGDAVLFLCSPAGNQITGTQLSMDGGWTAR